MKRQLLLNLIVATVALSGITVVRADDAADAQITERVKSALSEKDRDVASRIQVKTQEGVVTLSGPAMTTQYMLNAVRDAGKVDGVVKVTNHLTLN